MTPATVGVKEGSAVRVDSRHSLAGDPAAENSDDRGSPNG
jgi:hypothetical protein